MTVATRAFLAGAAVFVVLMLGAAAAAIASGRVVFDAPYPIDLRPWLRIELPFGFVAAALAGATCRRLCSWKVALWLGGALSALAALESAQLALASALGFATVQTAALFLSPGVVFCGVCAGTWLVGRRSTRESP